MFSWPQWLILFAECGRLFFGYRDLLSGDDVSIRVLGLDGLIRLKHAAGRARDLEVVAELFRIKKQREGQA